jgi:hypothetical protein
VFGNKFKTNKNPDENPDMPMHFKILIPPLYVVVHFCDFSILIPLEEDEGEDEEREYLASPMSGRRT